MPALPRLADRRDSQRRETHWARAGCRPPIFAEGLTPSPAGFERDALLPPRAKRGWPVRRCPPAGDQYPVVHPISPTFPDGSSAFLRARSGTRDAFVVEIDQ